MYALLPQGTSFATLLRIDLPFNNILQCHEGHGLSATWPLVLPSFLHSSNITDSIKIKNNSDKYHSHSKLLDLKKVSYVEPYSILQLRHSLSLHKTLVVYLIF